MKSKIYFLLFVFISLLGCSENPSNPNKDSIINESKTVTNNSVFHRDSLFNTDTLTVSLETSSPDVYVFVNLSLEQRIINSYSYTILQIDTPSIPNVSFLVRHDYTEILWITAYETNNRGFEIQRKDSNESSYI